MVYMVGNLRYFHATGMTGRRTDARPISTRPCQNLPGDGLLGEGWALTCGILGELTYELE